jgi:hypothetical protein
MRFFKYVLYDVNSAEYLFRITNNYNEEGVANFSVFVELSTIRKYVLIFEVF